MIKKSKYILSLILLLIVLNSTGQNSQVLYFMNIPQNHLENPALRPSNSFYLGLPALSGINLNINNNLFNFSDLFINSTTSDSVYSFLHPKFDVETFLSKVKNNSFITPEVSVQIFGLGFSAGKDTYVFLDINDRVSGNVVLPKDIFNLALRGNEGFVGKTIDLSTLGADMKYYREYGLGFSKNFTNRLRIGAKVKILTGIASASVKNNGLGITVNSDYTHTLNADMAINFSAPLIVTKNSSGDISSLAFDDARMKKSSEMIKFLLGGKNKGIALDLGATFDITDRLVVSGALTDFGYINWKSNLLNLKAKSTFEFSGLNIVDVVNGSKTMDELLTEMTDSLKNSFVVTDSKEAFKTFLPAGVSVGGSYSVTKSLSLGLLSYSRFVGKQVHESLTLSANLNVSNKFSTSFSYTAANHRYDNLGFGLAFRPGFFQFYLMTDRIPVTWNRIKTDTNKSMILPTSFNNVNLRIGMNLVFGNKIKKKDDKPMVVVE